MVKQDPDVESKGAQAVRWTPGRCSWEQDLTVSPSRSPRLAEVPPKEEEISNDAGVTEEVPTKMNRTTKPSECLPNEDTSMQLLLITSSTCENGTVSKDLCKKASISSDRGRSASVVSSRHHVNLRRNLPSIGAFTVQCASCFKWRLIPTKEQYEEIRQCNLEKPFKCEVASSWRPNASCNDPADLSQDMSLLWAIDKPNIPCPPPGWERLLTIRGEGSSNFADIYYIDPLGKKLRSMPEVERFLAEHPEYIRAGVSLSQFSFMSPRPLYQGYTRKRPARISSAGNAKKCFQKREADNSTEMKPSVSKQIVVTQEAEKPLARRKTLDEILAEGQPQRLVELQQHDDMPGDQNFQGIQSSQQYADVATDHGSQNANNNNAPYLMDETCQGSQKVNEACSENGCLSSESPQTAICLSPVLKVQVASIDCFDLDRHCTDLKVAPLSTHVGAETNLQATELAVVVEGLKDHNNQQAGADAESGATMALSLVPDIGSVNHQRSSAV